VIKLDRIIKDYHESGALNARVNITAAIDERTFLTKGGGLVMMLRVEGVDYECLDASEIDHVARRFESALRTFGDDFRLYQYVLKRDHASIPSRTYKNPVVQQATSSRIDYLQATPENLYTLETYFAVVYEGLKSSSAARRTLSHWIAHPIAGPREALSTDRQIGILEEDLARGREFLGHKVMSFVAQLPESLRAEVMDKDQAFGFLRRLLNYAQHKTDGVRLKYDDFVDFQACDSALECHRDHLRLDDYYVSVLTAKEPPGRTFAHLLRGLLDIPCNFVLASEWKRESNQKMLGRIHSKRRHFHNTKSSLMNYATSSAQTSSKDMLVNDAAVAQVGDLGACLEELEVKGRSFGAFSMTVALFDENRTRVKRAVADCFKVFATHDAQVTEERYNLLNAWLAILPGNNAYNLRSFWLLDTNYADLSFLFTLHMGEKQNLHLGGAEYLAVLETNHRTPYFLNLHCGDIAHTLILGGTGSGKSFLVNFLLTHGQKYEPQTYVFDLGGSYQHVTRLFGGAYAPVGIEQRGFTINPFSLPPTKENLHFLFSFLKVLIESSAYQLTAQDERDLYEQIENLYVIDAEQRRLYTLSNLLSRNLRAPLQKWVEGGPYATFFDNAEDNLTLARFQTFDFEGMEKIPQILEPLLFYILHRANASIYDAGQTAALKFFVIDEAWRFLRHPTIRQYILEALKTWRKKNAAMILATQSSDDLLRSEMLSVVVESCATKMFLANPDIDQKLYREVFHLNETESGLISQLVPKRQILVKRPDMSKVVNLRVGLKDYWLYTSNPFDRERRREAFERYGFEQGLEILARSQTS
jgi:type IV secretion/conjugal transfer VirB4 family ATPase